MEWVNTTTVGDKFITSMDVLLDTRIIYSDVMGIITVYDVKKDRTIKWKCHNHGIDCVKVLYYGKFATGARDGTIKIWDKPKKGDKTLTSMKLMYRLDEYGVVNNICLAGRNHIVSTHQHRTEPKFVVNIWDLKNNSVVKSKPFTGFVSKSAVQYLDNKIFIGTSGENQKDVKVWDVNYHGLSKRKNIVALAGHKGNVTSLAVLRDKLVSGSRDKSVKIWKKSGNSWSCEITRLRAQAGVRHLCTSWDKVIYITSDRKINIWDMQTGDVQIINVNESIATLVWYYGKIVTGSSKGVRIWEYKDVSSPVVKLGYKTFPTGTRLFTLITSETFDRTRDLAFFGKHLGLNVRATLHNTSESGYVWLHVFNTTGPLRMLTATNHWRQAIYGSAYISLAEVEKRLIKYCQKYGYDGWHMRVKMDNRVSNVKEAEYETVVLKSSFVKLQFRGKKRITLEDLKDKDHVRVSKNGKITFVKRIERLEEMFENLRF